MALRPLCSEAGCLRKVVTPRSKLCGKSFLEKARAAGYELRVSLEAEIGFGNRANSQALTKVATPVVHEEVSQNRLDITANDRRFLRSLRIAAEAVNQKVE